MSSFHTYRGPGEPCYLSFLPYNEEPVRDPPLIEDLDAARVQSAGAKAHDFLRWATLHNGNIDTR